MNTRIICENVKYLSLPYKDYARKKINRPASVITRERSIYMKEYFKSYGVTASITTHKDGTATLKRVCGTKKTKKTYKTRAGAYSAWRRMCD